MLVVVSDMYSCVSCLQLKGIGLSVLPGVDPNPDNYVSAGIITTTSALIGCLARLEPNFESKVNFMLFSINVIP